MDHQGKASAQLVGSNKSSQSGSFDFEQDNGRDTDRREVVVTIDADDASASHAAGSGSGSSVPSSPSTRNRMGETFSFKNRPSQSPPSPPVGAECGDDPAGRLIGNFLRKQAAAGGELLLDPDLEVDDNHETGRPPRAPTSIANSRELRVSFQDTHKRLGPSSSSASSSDATAENNQSQAANTGADIAEVLRCTSTSTGNSLLSRSRTRSRLMDPPPPSNGTAGADGERNDRKSFVMKGLPKSGQFRSGLIGKSGYIGKSGGAFDDEDDDPFIDEGVTADFKRERTGCLIILEWIGLLIIVATLVCNFTVPRLEGKEFSGLPLWKWEVLVFVLICGRLVSGWVLRMTVFFVERNFMLRKKVLYFVYGVRHAVRNVLWLGVALVSWHLLFDNDNRQETQTLVLHYVTKVLLCLLVATVIRLVKTLLVKVLASSFHVSTYFDRIQDALFNQYVIETLSGPPLVDESRMLADVQRLQSAGAAMPNVLQAATIPRESTVSVPKSGRLSKQLQKQNNLDDGISIDQLHKLNQKNISAWSMKRLMRIVRYGALTTMDDQIKHDTGLGDEMATEIHSEHEAKVAAKKIFHNVAKPGSKHIYLSDLMRFMRQEEAVKAMDLFEGAKENNRVSKRSLKNWVVNAFRERKALALTLNDTKTAVNKLHQMANVVVALIVLALWLLILGIATTRIFVLLSSQLFLAVFMFGNTLKTIFEAIIFLFVMHPFDVGDRCEVDGMQVVVEEMNILTTIFLRYDNLKIYYPNSQLAILPIMNYYRSPDMGDAVDFSVNVATPAEKLALMKERLMHYLDNKKEHWYPGSMVVLRDIDDTNRLKISIWCRHTINFQDMGMRFERRELILQEMMKILRDLDIEYRMLQLDINVRNAPPIHSNRMPTTWNTSF
ncbi:Mechanosensitive ion channel protein 5 [Hordeum vulgare]|uniref:Mechanosensitive ion channel protein n=1 Tax=Hordeum vulgare subsp. vulgare TaxID=112509 RepID=A0A8I6X6D0_HORVV|nr:mechanosensitive ion channel protein 5-like [Hordeum vulgare subsp. vulgare]KAE8775301.1 Mechanosensitive ion channel protein 5 [Hordeum vulgare]